MGSTRGLIALFLRLLITAGMIFNTSYEALAGASIPGQAADMGELVTASREQAKSFYEALERLLYTYGEDHASWPDNEDKRLIQDYLEKKDALTLNNCVFGLNLLGLGMGETSEDAKEALKQGQKDAWANPYSHILASGAGIPRPFNLLFAIAANRGAPLFNRDICKKVYVFMKADLHSQFADVFKNFNGETVLIMAREINIMGAPGSAEAGYAEELRPALCAADCLNATIYVGEKDRVTRIMPSTIRETLYSLFGVEFPFLNGKDRKDEVCPHEVPVEVVYLESCGHDVTQYCLGMSKHGTTMLRRKSSLP